MDRALLMAIKLLLWGCFCPGGVRIVGVRMQRRMAELRSISNKADRNSYKREQRIADDQINRPPPLLDEYAKLALDRGTEETFGPSTWITATSHCVRCKDERFSPTADPPCSKMVDDLPKGITDSTTEASDCAECHEPGFSLHKHVLRVPPCFRLLHVFHYYNSLVRGEESKSAVYFSEAQKADVPDKYLDEVLLDATVFLYHKNLMQGRNQPADTFRRKALDLGAPDSRLDEAWMSATALRVGQIAARVQTAVRDRNECFGRDSTVISLTRPVSDDNRSIFEQTFLQRSNLTGCRVLVNFGEGECDAGGPSIEWLNSVLESVTRSARRTEQDRNAGMGSLAHETRKWVPFFSYEKYQIRPAVVAYEEATQEAPKFLFEETNNYDIPVWSELGMGTREEGVLGPKAWERFYFLGQWLVLAHIANSMRVQCPRNLHPYMYASIAAGVVVEPDIAPSPYYVVEDQIQECEWLANLRGGYADLGPYAPLNNPGESQIRPIYRADSGIWESLYQTFGLDATGRQRPDHEVPHSHAAEYTKRVCKRVWMDRFFAPMAAIIKGFYSIIRPGELVPGELTGEELKVMLEGLPTPLSADRMLEHAEFATWDEDRRKGRWPEENIAMFKKAVKRLDSVELKTFLIFVTNNGREPLGGFVGDNKLSFNLIRQDKSQEQAAANKCPLVLAHTCSRSMDVPDACLMDPNSLETWNDEEAFVEALKESIPNRRYGFA